MIRKANMSDLEDIEKLYNDVLDYDEIHHYANWKRGLYPTKFTAKDGIQSGTLFVGEDDGHLFGSAVLNQIQSPEYKNLNWTYDALNNEVIVIHTLCISPFFQKQGKGAKFLTFAEDYARKLNCKYIRLDTHQNNIPAFSLYKKSGFNYVGTSAFVVENGDIQNFKCLDKKL